MNRRVMWMTVALVLGVAGGAQAQLKPPPKPSPSAAARDNSQAAQLPAGVDTGVPGSAQNAPVGLDANGQGPRGTLLRRRARPADPGASDVPRPAVNDSAAARLAARKPDAPARPAAPASGATPRK